jgi:hypothetical protein
MSSVQNVDFGIRNVCPVTLWLAGIVGKKEPRQLPVTILNPLFT